MNIQAPRNKNYSGVVVQLEKFVDLDGCDNVKAALIFGNSVIVAKSAKPGEIGIFFPVETALSHEFLSANSLYRKPEWGNVDQSKKGFFEQHGRVKAVKFRGHKSEGFWCPLGFIGFAEPDFIDIPAGAEFDYLNGIEICRKYLPKMNPAGTPRTSQGRQARLEDRIVDGQFRFHVDTENLRRNIKAIKPDSVISISEKMHGSSAVVAKLLVNKPLKWYEKVAKWLGIAVKEQDYGLIWSSRRVVKGIDGEAKAGAVHFYGTDVWSEVAEEIQDRIPPGFTVYGEIVGYTKDGSPIQKGYHYGCRPGTHRFLVYRVTFTTQDGHQVELGWPQIQEFCKKFDFEMVPTLFYGHAYTFLRKTMDQSTSEWQEDLLKELEAQFVHDPKCVHNGFEVPAEGIVVRVEHLDQCEVLKLKNFSFLAWESQQLDKGEVDLETAESVNE